MSVANLGDLSQSYAMRQRNVSIRQDIDRLTTELATGQVADLRDVLAGNYSYLTDIERRTSLLEGYDVATSEASLYTGSVQNALETIQSYGSDLASSFLIAGNGTANTANSTATVEARNALNGIVGVINTSSAGRYLFSGDAVNQPPLPDADTLLNALQTAVGGAATPDDLLAAATAWFDDPAGFQTVVYQGGTDAISPFQLSSSERISLDVRAVDPALREVLKLAAVVALNEGAAFGFDSQEVSELIEKSGDALFGTQDDIISLRSSVGLSEARIDQVAARNAAEKTSMEFAKVALLEIDPYEAATRLEEAQFQLQSLYSVTVRMSQLSLVNFL